MPRRTPTSGPGASTAGGRHPTGIVSYPGRRTTRSRIRNSPPGERFARRVPARNAFAGKGATTGSRRPAGTRPNALRSQATRRVRARDATREAALALAAVTHRPRERRTRQGVVRALAAPRPGVIGHTEFASRDPEATQAFLAECFGWRFRPIARPEEPDGTANRFTAPWRTGGTVRGIEDGERPKCVPFVETDDLEAMQDRVERAGGRILVPRLDLSDGQGAYILCEAPGGVTIGVWAPL